MNQLPPLLITLLTLVTLLCSKSLPLHPSYLACTPFECGGINITYPFVVTGHQASNCGVPGFEILCKNSTPIINLSGDPYIINSISYEQFSVNITNLAFSHPVLGCLGSIDNFTLDDALFKYPADIKMLLLLQDCQTSVSRSLSKPENIKCKDYDNQNRSSSFLAVYEEEFNPQMVGAECKRAVEVPYQDEDGSVGDIEEVLRKGIVLNYTAISCSLCGNSGGRCGFNASISESVCFCPDRPYKARCDVKSTGKTRFRYAVILASLAGTLLLIFIFLFLMRKKLTDKLSGKFTWENRKFETFLENFGSLAPKRYTYSDIKKLTNSFKEKLGEGGYGGVYKGKLLDGRLVAVKLLKHSKGNGEEFINEVASISRTNHVNVVTLLGFCCAGQKRALVYEFMANGSLEKFTHDATRYGQPLPWDTLFNIALGIARGLEYLHQGCKTRILHFDIKPHNILLDEDFCPKIADFGLAKVSHQSKQSKVSMSGTRGTIGYIAPEMFCRNFGDVSHKSDVYSYGMMVLEVIGSRKKENVDVGCSSELYFPHWIYKQLEHEEDREIDSITNELNLNDEEKRLKRKMIIVSLWCIQTVPSSRPSMSAVVQTLEGSPESVKIPPMPSFSSPPRPQLDLSGSSIMTL